MGLFDGLSSLIFGPADFDTRVKALNSQWYALNGTIESCPLTVSSGPAFSQFYSDFYAWQGWYDKQQSFVTSDGDEKSLADYTRKLQEHTQIQKQYCSAGSYIPSVKDQPEDNLLGDLGAPLEKAVDKGIGVLEKWGGYLGLGLGVLLLAIVGGIVYIAVKGNVKGVNK